MLLCSLSSSAQNPGTIKIGETVNAEAFSKHGSKKELLSNLKLKEIEVKEADQEIRIWYHYARSVNKTLFVIKQKKGKWTGTHYLMNYTFNDKKETFKFDNFVKTELEPKSGWENTINELKDNGLYTLPNMKDIPNILHRTDATTHEKHDHLIPNGTSYEVEIRSPEVNRTYHFNNTKHYQDFSQPRKFVAIITVLKGEFSVNVGHPRMKQGG